MAVMAPRTRASRDFLSSQPSFGVPLSLCMLFLPVLFLPVLLRTCSRLLGGRASLHLRLISALQKKKTNIGWGFPIKLSLLQLRL